MVIVDQPFRYSDDGVHPLVCEAGKYKEEELSEVALDYCRRHGMVREDTENGNDNASDRVCNRRRAKSVGKNRQ